MSIVWVTMLLLKNQLGSIATDPAGCPDELKKKGCNWEMCIIYDLAFVKANDNSQPFICILYIYLYVYTCICISFPIGLHGYGEKCVGSHIFTSIGYMMVGKGKCMKQEETRKTD